MGDINNVSELSIADELKYDPATGDVYTVPWTDYSNISTIIGWDENGQDPIFEPKIYYKKVGKLVFCQYCIRGVSNNTQTSFSLPWADALAGYGRLCISVNLDNTSNNTLGFAYNINGVVTITKVYTGGENEWTASGTKDVRGSFWFEAIDIV